MAHQDTSEISQVSSSKPPRRTVTISTKPIIAVVAVVVLCGLSFWAGQHYQKGQTQSSSSSTTKAGAGFGGAGGFGGQRSFANRSGGFGQVTAVSSTSITITNERTNASQTFSITSSTAITDDGSTVAASDIQTGDSVLIRTSGSSSTTATAIEVNPSFGPDAGSSSASPAPSD